MTPDRLTLEQAVGKLAEIVRDLAADQFLQGQLRGPAPGNDPWKWEHYSTEAAIIARQFSTGEPEHE